MRKYLFILSTLLFLSSTNLLAGGPWTPNKNEGTFISSLSPVIYKTMSSASGEGIVLSRRVSDISFTNYLEFGITNSLALITNLDLKYVGTSTKVNSPNDFASSIPDGKLFGIGNSTIGLKYNFTHDKFLFSLSYATEFPALGEKRNAGLRTGAPTWGFVPGVHLGQGFDKKVYYFVEGYFVARNKYSHEWRLNAEVGYTFKKPLTMSLYISMRQSLYNKNTFDDSNYLYTGLYLNNQEFVAWSFKFSYELNDRMGISTALAGGFTTRLIARTPVISAGFYFKWKDSND